MKRVILWMGIGVVVVALGAAGALYVMADGAASRYEQRVHTAAKALEKRLAAIGDTTYRGIMEDPDQSSAGAERDIAAIAELISGTRHDLQTLSDASASLEEIRFAHYVPPYEHAQKLQDKTQATVRQIDEALTNYSTLVSFLKAYRGAKQSFQTELGIFNGVSDFNTFAGRGDEFRAGATRLRTAATVLQNVTTPPAMVDLSKNIRASLSEAADEFDDVGHGFDVAVDDLIYGPVHKIEATTATFESQERKWYTSALENSRILRDTRDLLEKIDPVSDVPR